MSKDLPLKSTYKCTSADQQLLTSSAGGCKIIPEEGTSEWEEVGANGHCHLVVHLGPFVHTDCVSLLFIKPRSSFVLQGLN